VTASRDVRAATTVAVVLVLAAAVAGVLLLRDGGPTVAVAGEASAAGAGAGPVSTGPAAIAGGVVATASCTSAPSRAADGTPTSFDAGNAVDGRMDTAWRCDGDGVGDRLVLRLPRSGRVSQLTIVPGYAKTDQADGSDRYAQNRRISGLTVDTGDGPPTAVSLDPSPTRRAAQTVRFPAAETDTVTLTITSSVPGAPVGTRPASDRVAISEVTFPELR